MSSSFTTIVISLVVEIISCKEIINDDDIINSGKILFVKNNIMRNCIKLIGFFYIN